MYDDDDYYYFHLLEQIAFLCVCYLPETYHRINVIFLPKEMRKKGTKTKPKVFTHELKEFNVF